MPLRCRTYDRPLTELPQIDAERLLAQTRTLAADEFQGRKPDLELEDVTACLRFASRRLAHPIVAA